MGDSGPHRSDHYSPYSPSTSSYRGDWRYEPPRAPRWPQQDQWDRQAQSSRDAHYGSVAPDYCDSGGRSRQYGSPSSSSSESRGSRPAPRHAPGPAPLPPRPGPAPPRPLPAPEEASMRSPVHPLPPKPKAKTAAKPPSKRAPASVSAPTMRAEDHQPNAEGRSRLQRHRVPTAPPTILPTRRPPPAPLRPPVVGRKAQLGPSGQSPARGHGNANGRASVPAARQATERLVRNSLAASSTSSQPAPLKEKPRAVHQLFPWERPSGAVVEEEEQQQTEPGPSAPRQTKKRAPRPAKIAPHSHLTKPGGDGEPEEEVFPLEEIVPLEGAEVVMQNSAQQLDSLQQPTGRKRSSAKDEKDIEKFQETPKAEQPAGKTPKKTKAQKKAEKRAAAAAAAEGASSIDTGSSYQAACSSSSTDDWQPVTPPLSRLPQRGGIQVFPTPLQLSNGGQPASSDQGSSSDGPTKAEFKAAKKAEKKRRKRESAAASAAAKGGEVDSPKAKKAKKEGEAVEGRQSPEALRREERLACFRSKSSEPAAPSTSQVEVVVKHEVIKAPQQGDAPVDPDPSFAGGEAIGRPTLVLIPRDDDPNTTMVTRASLAATEEKDSARSSLCSAPDVEAMSLEAGSQQRQMSVSSDDIPLITTLSRSGTRRSEDNSAATKRESSPDRYRGTSFGPAKGTQSDSTDDTPSSVMRLSSRAEKVDMTGGKRQVSLAWRWKWMAMLECQSSLSNNTNSAASPSSALLAITPKGKTSLRFLSAGAASPACSHDLSFPSEMNIEAVRRVSSHAVAVASSSNNRVGEGGPQVSLVFAKDGKKSTGQKKTKDDIAMSEITARASAIHLNQRPHITGATSVAPFLPLSDQDALTMVTGGADGAVFAWSYSGSHAKSTNTTRLHALHSGTVTALETLPKLDLVVSASTVHQHRAGGATQLVAFDARETKLLHSWKSSDLVAHLSRTTHSRLLDLSLLRADYDQHKLYDLRVASGGSGAASASASATSSSRNPTKPILSFGWASEYDLPFLGRPAFKNNYCIQGCPDGKVRTWDLRWSSEVLQEVNVGEKGMPISDVLLWDRDKERERRTRSGEVDGGGRAGSGGTCVAALSPDAAWRIPLI